MRLVVSAGGTGGHVYPALTVIEALRQPAAGPSIAVDDILWVGSKGRIEEELVSHAGLPFVGLSAGGLRGAGLLARIRGTAQITASVLQAGQLLSRFRPDVVLSTGGYASVSVSMAAWLRRIPVLIYLPDIVPGLAIRALSRFAARIAVTSEESYRYFARDKVIVTGYPARRELFTHTQTAARQALGLAAEPKVLLAFGGSQGAHSINQAIVNGLESLLPVCQVVHVCGRLDAEWATEAADHLPESLQARYHVYPYLHDMPVALAAADLAVARAGAATLGEFPAAGLPAVLVPYPYSGQHQNPNADFMTRNGAARTLADSSLATELVPMLVELLGDEAALVALRQSSKALARPDAASVIAEQLRLLALRRRGRTENQP